MKLIPSTISHIVYAVLASFIFSCSYVSAKQAEKDKDVKRVTEEIKQNMLHYMKPESVDFFSDFLDEELFESHSFKINIPKKDFECFYQPVKKHTELKFNFECISPPTFASPGKISAFVESTTGREPEREEVNDVRKGAMSFKATKNGEVMICLDNKEYSASKTVQLWIETWRIGEITNYHLEQQQGNNSIYHIYDRLYQVRHDLSLIKSALMHTKLATKYDALTLYSNLSMVNSFSIISVFLIFGVCGLQIYVVKRMFLHPNTGS